MSKRVVKLRVDGLTCARAAAFAAALAGTLGCGAEYTETVGEAREQLGSTKQRVDVKDWDGLTKMVSDGNYRLTANIDANGKTWTPKDFQGTFDGNNKTISNLTITVPTWYPAGFFAGMTNAIVKNARFINLKITSGQFVGGIAGSSSDSLVDNCAVEVTITGGVVGGYAGGVYGQMSGGTVSRTYTKGSITGTWAYAGGLVGEVWSPGGTQPMIERVYAQMEIAPSTSTSATVTVGGIAGSAYGTDIHDVYAVGNVTGRGSAGGLVGNLDCNPDVGSQFAHLYRAIYRGELIDKAKSSASGGWSGTLGTVKYCPGNRVANLFWDSSLDRSTKWYVSLAQEGASSEALRQPITPIGGVYCAEDVVPGRCGDNTFTDPPWDAGTDQQHHALRSMPGPNPQPR
jgi:hypothetical protein